MFKGLIIAQQENLKHKLFVMKLVDQVWRTFGLKSYIDVGFSPMDVAILIEV
jgi:hypothetical protein